MNTKLGLKARDKITGFSGVVTGHADYITGCDQYLITPIMKKDGKLEEARWIDENRLEFSGKQIVLQPTDKGRKGADLPAPIK